MTRTSSDLKVLLDQLLGAESCRLLEQTGARQPASFRFNSLKHDREFQQRLLAAEGVRWESFGGDLDLHRSISDEGRPVGKSLAHFLGQIYIQDPASAAAAYALAPEPGDWVLDLCAAPGSKTTLLAERMRNQGALVANDVAIKRIRGLIFNLRRMGVANTAVIKSFGEQLGNIYFETFDKVLLDAPCSALGTLHKSPEVLSWWSFRRSGQLAREQAGLLYSGLKALKPGGTLVYSTCTLAPEENEFVIDDALSRFPVDLEPVTLAGLRTRPGLTRFGDRELDSRLERAVRLYPHENPCEGFFIARLRKTETFGEPRLRKPTPVITPMVGARSVRGILSAIGDSLGIRDSVFQDWCFQEGPELCCCSGDFRDFPFRSRPVRSGLPIVHTKHRPYKLTTEGSHLFGDLARRRVVDLSSLDELFAFANRQKLPGEGPSAEQVLVRFEGHVIGHGAVDKGFLQSRFPRTAWKFGPD
jgi:16S rRNA (cytosine1407-C5)-methyltransferase